MSRLSLEHHDQLFNASAMIWDAAQGTIMLMDKGVEKRVMRLGHLTEAGSEGMARKRVREFAGYRDPQGEMRLSCREVICRSHSVFTHADARATVSTCLTHR